MAISAVHLLLALASAFALSFLQGCGGNSSPAPAPAPTPTTSTTTTTTTTSKQKRPPAPPPKGVMKGVAYGPVPMKALGMVPNDDFFCDRTEPLWGSAGRGDLEILKSLGANAVRLYGNDPRYPHGKFFDEAESLDIAVVVGFSDYPYTQSPANCVHTQDRNCFQAIKEQYAAMLESGDFLHHDTKQYHSALRHVILMNEPELKIPQNLGTAGYAKALVSAFDGALQAEKDAGVTGELPSFTATFSFAICDGMYGQGACEGYGNKPGVGQMYMLHKAMLDPDSVGYTAKNDLSTAYQERFVNSFNTANPASDMHPMFLYAYQDHFGQKPVFIGEFHKPHWNTAEDMQQIMQIAADTENPLFGAAFFEFQVRYDKGGSEMDFGMFGLGDKVVGTVPLGDSFKQYDIMCLNEVDDPQSGMTMAAAVTQAYGGTGVKPEQLCAARAKTANARANATVVI